MAKSIFSKQERHDQAVKIGIKLGKSVGLARVSLGKVAEELKVTAPLLFHVFGSRVGFHKAVAKAAKAQGITFPESTPTVRAARAIRAAEREKAAKKATLKVVVKAPKAAAPKVTAPKAAAPKVVAPKPAAKKAPVKKVAVKAAAKVVAPKPAAKKAPVKKVAVKAPVKKVTGKIKVPKVVAPELAKFPAMPVPTTAVAAAA